MKAIAVALLLNAVSAKMAFGPCPQVDYLTDLDETRFAGNWYEISRDSTLFMEMGYECTTQQFTLNDDGDLDFYFRANFLHPLSGYNGIGGTTKNCGTSDEWTCQAYMPTTSARADQLYPLIFLDTDYDNYAISYACMNMMWDGMHYEYWNILARDTTLAAEHVAAAEAKLYEKVPGMDINWFTKHNTEHYWCTHDWSLA